MADEGRRVLGINVAASVAYLGLVDIGGMLVLKDPLAADKIEPPSNVGSDWGQLQSFGKRLVEEAKAVQAQVVVFAETRKTNDWVYSDAFARASLIVAAGLGAVPN